MHQSFDYIFSTAETVRRCTVPPVSPLSLAGGGHRVANDLGGGSGSDGGRIPHNVPPSYLHKLYVLLSDARGEMAVAMSPRDIGCPNSPRTRYGSDLAPYITYVLYLCVCTIHYDGTLRADVFECAGELILDTYFMVRRRRNRRHERSTMILRYTFIESGRHEAML